MIEPIEIPFGEFLPDLPVLKNPGATEALNVIPSANSYLPLKAVSPITDALGARCRGAVTARDKSGQVYNYAGDETSLYSLSSNTHADISNGTYALAESENWEFVKFGETLIATCINESPQSITLGGASFADLGGTPPKARHCAVVSNFVVLGNINDGTDRPQRVRWAGINSTTSWTPNADTQSDFQDLFSDGNYGGGWIMGVTGGEYGNVFQEYSIWRMNYVGSPLIFSFEEVLPGVGTPCKNSITQEGRITHFLSQDGFMQLIDGSQVQAIGKNKVDNYFFNDFDATYPERVIGSSDPNSGIVMWIYPGSGNVNGQPNKILIYDSVNNKWSRAEDLLEWIYSAIGQGYTLEQLDAVSTNLDTLTPSLDSRAWMGGALQLAVYDDDNIKGTFGGVAMNGTIETSEAQIVKGKRSFLSGVRPLVDGDGVVNTVQVGTRNLQNNTVSWGSAVTPNADTGISNTRVDSRYHRVRVNTSGDYDHAIGIDAYVKPTGHR